MPHPEQSLDLQGVALLAPSCFPSQPLVLCSED